MVAFEYSSQAVDWLEKVDSKAREQIQSTVEGIYARSHEPFYEPDHFLEPYSNCPYAKITAGQYRLVADWRKREQKQDVFIIRRIGHRNDFYAP